MQKFAKNAGETNIPDLDFYFMKYSLEKQERLLKIRLAIMEKHPGATERIYYGIPTVEASGKIILQYAAYKNHISIIVGNVLPLILKEKYPQYNYTDHTVIFFGKEPFPDDFVKEICGTLGKLTGEDFYAPGNNKKRLT